MFPNFSTVPYESGKMHQNATNYTNCPWEMRAVAIVIYSSFMFFSLLGNGLIIVVFYRNKSLRTSLHHFIMNMALSDLLISTISLPTLTGVAYFDFKWLVGGIMGALLCKFAVIAVKVSIAVSAFSMLAIAVDRFNAIVFPMKPALFCQKTCHRLIIVIWIISVAIQGYYFDAAGLGREGTGVYCKPGLEKISSLCLYAIVGFVLTVLYSIMIAFLYCQNKDLHLASEVVKLRAKENRKITSMLVIIVVAFYLVWASFYIYLFQGPGVNDECSWTRIAEILPLFYVLINFIVFVIFNKTFRKGCKELLCRPWFCTKCNACSLASAPAQEHYNSAPKTIQQNPSVLKLQGK